MTEESCEVKDLGSLHHFRTEIPNIIFEMKLDPYEFMLYCVLKRTAGDAGSCFKSNATLCEEIGCQKPKLIEVKKSLQVKGLIKIKKRTRADGCKMPDLINITDMWDKNAEMYLSKKKSTLGGSNLRLPGVVIDDYQGSNLRLPKEDPNEEDHFKEQQQQLPAAVSFDHLNFKKPSDKNVQPETNLQADAQTYDKNVQLKPIHESLINLDIPEFERQWLTDNYDEKTVKNAVEWATDALNPPKKSLSASIKFACKNGLSRAIPKEDEFEANKSYALKHDGIKLKDGSRRVEALSKYVEISFSGNVQPFCLGYEIKGFIEQFKNALRKNNFIPLES